MKIDNVPDAELAAFATRILDRAHTQIGYSITGVHMVMQAYAKTRPGDLRTFLRVVAEDCA